MEKFSKKKIILKPERSIKIWKMRKIKEYKI